MGKFKKGDRVKVVNQYNSTDEGFAPNGTTGTITTVGNEDTREGGNYHCNWDTDGYHGFVWGEEIELINDHKFKVGDRVRVKRGLRGLEYYGDIIANTEMQALGGQIMTVSVVNGNGTYNLKEEPTWYWSEEMLEPVKETDSMYADVQEQLNKMVVPEFKPIECWSQYYGLSNHGRRLMSYERDNKVNNNLGERIMETLRTIPKRLKKVLDKDYKAMYQLNWLNGDLERTSKGTEELMDFLIDKYKDDLGALARERVKEIEDENES